MRITPSKKYEMMPCSYVGVGCAYEDYNHMCFNEEVPEGLKNDGYLSLENANKFIRKYLRVKKKQYFKRSERILLKDFLKTNTEKCCICVLGHFLYANKQDYWSFFDNDNDEIVCIWYLREIEN